MTIQSKNTITDVCILGGGGFLGSHLAAALIDSGSYRVQVIDRTFAKLEVFSEQLERIETSISDPGILEQAVLANDVIISTTALCNPALYNTKPVEVIDANYTDLVPLVKLCTEKKRRLIHFSTCEVYGLGSRNSDGEHLPMSEDNSELVLGSIDKERWSYAAAKQLLERLIWAHGQHHGLEFSIVRPFNVIGERMDFLPGVDGEGIPRVLASFVGALLSGRPLDLVDGGNARRSFLYVREFCDAVVKIIERPAPCKGQIINLGNPANDVSMAELADTMIKVFASVFPDKPAGQKRQVSADEFYGAGYDDVQARIPNIDKARSTLDWTPKMTIDEILLPILRDYEQRYGTQPQKTRRATQNCR